MRVPRISLGKLFNVLQSPIGRMASWPMRNIKTFPSKQMYLYLSLVERKEKEFYHNIDWRRFLVWFKWLIFIAFPGQFMVSLAVVCCCTFYTLWINKDWWKAYKSLPYKKIAHNNLWNESSLPATSCDQNVRLSESGEGLIWTSFATFCITVPQSNRLTLPLPSNNVHTIISAPQPWN